MCSDLSYDHEKFRTGAIALEGLNTSTVGNAHVSEVECTGLEDTISQCQLVKETGDCGGYKSAGVICQGER